ncbi:uncharacterized protein FOMMEDRAFT_139617 [Fomitiporia mediterranea MF3/22]|uniref:uncharacterized protein n=1 Tax=Fomitiporia mediterranea (strain MF3/22) TaxID=694068 RepID=UPI000440747C|nr:uncharacterized protein FOMMEDRAFT_139617 [Fomitiporia mediterranea MF3/22]EJD04999.1 hypothetical protein FOMMEDRAFT_139617 [Fomitiporia mediterranea MF3/22]
MAFIPVGRMVEARPSVYTPFMCLFPSVLLGYLRTRTRRQGGCPSCPAGEMRFNSGHKLEPTALDQHQTTSFVL